MAERSAACLNFKQLSRKHLQVISSSKRACPCALSPCRQLSSPGPTLAAELSLPRLPVPCHTPRLVALKAKAPPENVRPTQTDYD